MFPAHPGNSENDSLFLIQDPFGLQQCVLPMWSLLDEGLRLEGLGTAFRINRSGVALTAYHVLEHMLTYDANGAKRPVPIEGSNPLVLEVHGYRMGKGPISAENWLPIENFDARVAAQTDPFTQPKPQNLTELIALLVPSKTHPHQDHPFLSMSRRRVEVGEKLLAVGYSEMCVELPVSFEEACTVSSYLHGSFRRVTEIVPAAQASSRPWPRIVVDGDWPAGMSGGPVFDETGHVIGVVSTGSPGSYATARSFWGDNPFPV